MIPAEELPDGLFGHDSANDENHAGRNQYAEAAAGCHTPVARPALLCVSFPAGWLPTMVAAVAWLEPQMAENAAQAQMVAIARPPGRWPAVIGRVDRRALIPE